MPNDADLRRSLIRLAHTRPEFRGQILPLLKTGSYSRASVVLEMNDMETTLEEFQDKVEEMKDGAPPDVVKSLSGVLKANNELLWAVGDAKESAATPEKPAKKAAKRAAIRGFDGLQNGADTFVKDLASFRSQLESDIEEAPQAFKVLYKPLLAKLDSVQPVLKELSAAAKKVDDALAKSREKTSGKPSKK